MNETNAPNALLQTRINGKYELEILVRARYSIIYVVSWEEDRVIREIDRIAKKLIDAMPRNHVDRGNDVSF